MHVIISAIKFDEKSPILASLSLSSWEKSLEKQVCVCVGGGWVIRPPGLDRVKKVYFSN